mmetsp:Transcript_6030/g.10369  ORF Transcript_6030/g.10369 Transcript_6030/m.10369 type:complete len:110 (-) Transcript_6030:420-749(-)
MERSLMKVARNVCVYANGVPKFEGGSRQGQMARSKKKKRKKKENDTNTGSVNALSEISQFNESFSSHLFLPLLSWLELRCLLQRSLLGCIVHFIQDFIQTHICFVVQCC